MITNAETGMLAVCMSAIVSTHTGLLQKVEMFNVIVSLNTPHVNMETQKQKSFFKKNCVDETKTNRKMFVLQIIHISVDEA